MLYDETKYRGSSPTAHLLPKTQGRFAPSLLLRDVSRTPRYGNTLYGNSLRGLAEESVFASQTLATAEAWIQHAMGFDGGNIDSVRRPNDAPIVQKIIRCTIGGSGNTADPYCALWVWLVLKGAAQCLGAQNCFPLEGGNTRGILAKAKQLGLTVNETPAVGAVFYRGRMNYQTDRPTGSTTGGHMGIVTEILPDGGFKCIEANGKSSEKKNVALARGDYSRSVIAVFQAERPRNGHFQFIHVELCPVPSSARTKGIASIGNDCMPVCSIPNVPPEPPTPPIAVQPSEPPSRIPPEPLPPTPEPPDPRCENLIVVPCSRSLVIPSGAGVQHFDIFRTMRRDVKERWFTSFADDELGTIGASEPFHILTQFPMVKDRHGKRIIISADDEEVWSGVRFARMHEMELWGKNPDDVAFYHLARRWKGGFLNVEDKGWVGGGWAEKAALELLTPTSDGGRWGLMESMQGWFTWDGSNAKQGNNKRINAPSVRRRWNDFKPDDANFFSIFEKIERLGAPSGSIPSTYVIVLEGSVDTWLNENIEIVLGVMTAVLVVAATLLLPGLGTAAAVALGAAISGALSVIVRKAAAQQEITFADVTTALVKIGTAIANTKGASPEIQQFGRDLEKYAGQATNALGAVASKDWIGLARQLSPVATQAFPELTNIIGANGQRLEGAFLLANGAHVDIQRIIGGDLKDVAGTVAQYASATAMRELTKLLAAGSSNVDGLIQGLTGGNTDILSSPIIRNIFLGQASGAGVGIVPGMSDVARSLLNSPAHHKANAQDPHLFSAWGALALGTNPSSNILDSFQLNSLFQRAEDLTRNNLAFAAPPTIAPERRECYEREVMNCLRLDNTSTCEPPKVYNTATRTCEDPCPDGEERNPETGQCEKKKWSGRTANEQSAEWLIYEYDPIQRAKELREFEWG